MLLIRLQALSTTPEGSAFRAPSMRMLTAQLFGAMARPDRDHADRQPLLLQFLQYNDLLQTDHPTPGWFDKKSDRILDYFRSGWQAPEQVRSPENGEFYFGAFGKFSPGGYSFDCLKVNKQRIQCDSCLKCGWPFKAGFVDNTLKLIVAGRFKWSARRRLITDAKALFPVECYIKNNR